MSTTADVFEMTDTEIAAWARDEIVRLGIESAERHSENLRLLLALSCILPIAEKCAADGPERRTCALIRTAIGLPPASGKPRLSIVKDGEAS
jgi:hypothetical protein